MEGGSDTPVEGVGGPGMMEERKGTQRMAVLENGRERFDSNNAFTGHLIERVLEEIALEGLDGITVQALKIRLEQRTGIEHFEIIAPAIWNQLRYCLNLKFYLLPKPRPDLVRYRWDDCRDARGNVYEPLHAPEDIYKYYPVEDKQRWIRGSCEHYLTRKDISSIARNSTYVQIIQGLGNRLVIVANQGTRERILLGSNFRKYRNINVTQYCMMERIGRARDCGEVTRGKISLACLNIQPKAQFYQREYLLKAGLITKQATTIKFGNSKFPACVTVFHLPRFVRKIESVSSINTRTIFSWLNNSPTKSVQMDKLTGKFSKRTVTNFSDQFSSFVETGLEWEQCEVEPTELEDGEEQTVKSKSFRVLRLLVTDVSLQNQALSKTFEDSSRGQNKVIETTGGGEEGGGDNQGGREQMVNVTSAISYSDVQILRPVCQFLTSTHSVHLLHSMMRSGLRGLTILDIRYLLTLTPLESRSCCRFFTRHKVCNEGTVQLQGQKVLAYILANFTQMNVEIQMELSDKLMTGLLKIRQILSTAQKRQSKSKEKQIMRMKERKERRKKVRIGTVTRSHTRNSFPKTTSNQTETLNTVPVQEKIIMGFLMEKTGQQDNNSDILSSFEKSKSPELSNIPVNGNEDVMSMLAARGSPIEPLVLSESSPSPGFIAVINNFDAVSATDGPENSVQVSPLDFHGRRYDTNESVDTFTTETNVSKDNENVDHMMEAIVKEDKMVENSNNNEAVVENIYLETGKTGRKPEDEVDECIRRHMTRQRVAWTSSEDRLMLLAFIASSLFLSKYSYDRIFIYNSTQIRDIMLKKSNLKSNNKTTKAIRRRLHFLLRQKTHFDWYIQHVGEAVRDNVLYENFIREHLPPPISKLYRLPPNEALEAVVDYLEKIFNEKSPMMMRTEPVDKTDSPKSPTAKHSLSGVDTLLFLRQLKRAEFYWNCLLFVIFCRMGTTSEARRKFYTDWKLLQQKNIQSDSSNLPVFEMEEVKEVQMEIKEISNNGREESLKTPQDLFLDYCWKFLKFLIKHSKIMFNDILMLGGLPANKFQIAFFDRNIERGSSSNICLSLRECSCHTEARFWTARSLILEQLFSGNKHSGEFVTIGKNGNLPMEKAARSLNRCKILVTSKGTDLLRLSKNYLKSFVGGLPLYSFHEIRDLLRVVNEGSTRVDAQTCDSVGLLLCLVELTDYWTAQITSTKSIFSFRRECNNTLSTKFAEGKDKSVSPSHLLKSVLKSKASEKIANVSKGKKRKRRSQQKSNSSVKVGRPLKRRKKSKEDKLVNEIAEYLSDLSVNGDGKESTSLISEKNEHEPPVHTKLKVGLEEGENYMCHSTDPKLLQLHRIRLHQSAVPSSIEDDSRQQTQEHLLAMNSDQGLNINLPNLEFKFSKKTIGLNLSIVGSSHPFSLDNLKDLRKCLVELVYHQVPSPDNLSGCGTAQSKKKPNLVKYLNRYNLLFETINLSGVVGVSGTFLQKLFERKSLLKGLLYLLEARLIFSLGVMRRRFVTFNNVKDWTIPIRPKTSSRAVVGHVIMRPWINAVGGISWTTINRLFTALVGQLQKPDVELTELCQLLTPTLSPVESLVLIEALAKLQYVLLYKIREPNVTLFSKHPHDNCDIEYKPDTLIDTENIFVAVSPYIVTLHAQLRHAIRMTSKQKN